VADNYRGELDPEISNFISTVSGDIAPSVPSASKPSGQPPGISAIDPNQKKFKRIDKVLENPKPYFSDKDFYKKVLANEGENAKKVHEILAQFLNAKDPQDKSLYRNRIIPAFWNLASSISSKISEDMPLSKTLLLRFGILSPSLLSADLQALIAKVVFKNMTGEPIHYMDEWLMKIASGVVNASATDELRRSQKDDGQKILDKVDHSKGQRDAEIGVLRTKIMERDAFEEQLFQSVNMIRSHNMRDEYDGLSDSYSPEQKRLMSGINDILRRLNLVDREIEKSYNSLRNLEQNIDQLSRKADGIDTSQAVDSTKVVAEFNSLRQMAKLCVGRKGNHFPILIRSYFLPSLKDLGIRENVINEMAMVEELDSGLFLRTFKNTTTRIVPNVILLPNYGERGICWEPFERRNRASSRGRLAIPMYSKNLRYAVIAALADLRWQIAKEKAQHHWMEEGITGRYYQWFSEQKLRGDVKEYFINDYILWITKETEGTQKLDRTVRGIFWRMIPFPQEIKEKLKNRGFVYNELYKKDVNISKSDGY
jgi:hypothetical protein